MNRFPLLSLFLGVFAFIGTAPAIAQRGFSPEQSRKLQQSQQRSNSSSNKNKNSNSNNRSSSNKNSNSNNRKPAAKPAPKPVTNSFRGSSVSVTTPRPSSTPSNNSNNKSSKKSSSKNSSKNSNKKPASKPAPQPVVSSFRGSAPTVVRAPAPKPSSKQNHNNNSKSKSKSKQSNKNHKPNVASTTNPNAGVFRGSSVTSSALAGTMQPRPQTPGNNNSNKNANNNRSGNHSGHNHNTNRYRAQSLSAVAVRPTVSKNWDPRYYNNSSVWNRAQRHDGHDHHSDYHPNFSNSLNYAYRPSAWGSDPWWGQQDRHDYQKGCWDYGWNDRYTQRHSLDRGYYPPGYSRPSSGILGKLAWGLAGWGLGSMAYDTGYNTYSNPYSAPPVDYGVSSYSYAEPLAVASAARIPDPPEQAATNEQLSSEAMDQAMEEFREGDYISALQSVDEAIAFTPSDSVLHEFRALNFFALGRYGDAAGVLNPLLASGPGWDWDTMIGFYNSDDAYTKQFRRLEDYVDSDPESADSRFLLGYHYMVGGYLAEAREMFNQVAQIEPQDSVAIQLRNLAQSSMPTEEVGVVGEEIPAPPAPGDMITEETVAGNWRALSSDGKTITLDIKSDGKFTWNFEGAPEGSALSGDWSIDEDGLLVLNDEDVQLAGSIEMDGNNTMRFVLAGTPEGDPGLAFERM